MSETEYIAPDARTDDVGTPSPGASGKAEGQDAMAEISSSAWITVPPSPGKYFIMNSSTCVAGVIG